MHRAQARRAEAARIAESNGKNEDGTSQSQRPDTKARAVMSAEGLCVNTHKTAGHVPGHPPSNRCACSSASLCPNTWHLAFMLLARLKTITALADGGVSVGIASVGVLIS